MALHHRVLSVLPAPTPANIAQAAQTAYARIFRNRSTSLLPFIPRSVKLLFLLLVLLNSPSFPFQWHIRVWWHAIKAYYLVFRKGRKRYLDDWSKRNRWDGGIRGIRTVTKRKAWVDDCDYNMHLSNSCYAKNSDPSRMKYCIRALSPLFTPNVIAALAASHYVFLKEVPIGSDYVIETRAGGWGEKWFYIVSEFVIYPKKGAASRKGSKGKTAVKELEDKLASVAASAASQAGTNGVIPSISTAPSGTDTPDSPTSAPGSPTMGNGEVDSVKRAAALRARAVRPDGGVVCCLAVFEYCFKIGRVTIPPRIALHYSLQSPTEEGRAHARKLILSKDHGAKWLRGGWKDEPNASTLGRDIGHESGDNGEAWIENGRKAMQDVNAALTVF